MKLLVFIVAFIIFASITLVVYPSLPPGGMLFTFLSDVIGISDATYSIFGFSGESISSGIINGLSWGSLFLILFSLGSYTSARKVSKITAKEESKDTVLTDTVPTPISIATLIGSKQPMIRTPLNVSKIRTYVTLDQDINVINGIGPKYGDKLRFYGIHNIEDLLREGATWKGRWNLADYVGVTNHKIFTWVNQADFFRIDGIGRQYAGLLDAAGVNTIADLSGRNAQKLYNELRDTNWEKNLVKRIPPLTMIENWIQRAIQLESIIEH